MELPRKHINIAYEMPIPEKKKNEDFFERRARLMKIVARSETLPSSGVSTKFISSPTQDPVPAFGKLNLEDNK